MITDFHDYLNESDDIRKRLEDRINKAFDKIRVKYPNPTPEEHKPVSKTEPVKGVIDDSGDLGEEPQLKPKKQKFSDKRLDDAFYALKQMGYVDKNIEEFLDSIILTDKVTATSIVRCGINNFRKLIG